MRDWVAIILAIGLCVAVVFFTGAMLYEAVTADHARLSPDAAQVLTIAIGGIIGLLGGYLGAKATRNERDRDDH